MMIRDGWAWLEPLAKVPAALARGADPNLPLGAGGPTLVEAGLLLHPAFGAMLEAGANPNVLSGRGWPVLLEVASQHGVGDGKRLIDQLVSHGARWDVESRVQVANRTITLPALLALPHVCRAGSIQPVFYALARCGADPGITDQWGGNLGHHAAPEIVHRSQMEQLGSLGVDLEHVAKGDEATVAWAKLTGEWVPGWIGLSPNEYWRKVWGWL